MPTWPSLGAGPAARPGTVAASSVSTRHQAQAINAARQGSSVMVATGTASGKTLCYNVPVLDAVLDDPLGRALYLFPTKALAQDQLRALNELCRRALNEVHLDTYDGDTAPSAAHAHAQGSHHRPLQPRHASRGHPAQPPAWASFFRHLRYVVLDEAHTYRGIFGSHVACLLRRLRRVCALYGAQSAVHPLLGHHRQPRRARRTPRPACEPVVVHEDGAPQGPASSCCGTRPLIDKAKTERRSVNSEAAWISQRDWPSRACATSPLSARAKWPS